MKLSEARLARPPRGRENLSDHQVDGLRVRGGARGWVFWHQGPERLGRDGGSARVWTRLGKWSPVPGYGLSLQEARRRALELQGRAESTRAGSENVRTLANDFLTRRYPRNAVRRSKVAALLDAHALPMLGGLPVGAVTRQHCVQVIQAALVERRVEEKGSPRRGGRAPAEALCRVLRQLFRDAVKTGRLETLAHSPAELLDPKDFGIPPARSRDRALLDEEMALLLTHPDIDLPGLLEGSPYQGLLSQGVRLAILLGPFLAVRPIAMLGMRWDELDLETATWTIAGGRGAKLRHHLQADARPFVVPLSPTPLEVLQSLEKQPHGDFVLGATLKRGTSRETSTPTR